MIFSTTDTTAGSEAKRDLLKAMGAAHVLDSRSLHFGDVVDPRLLDSSRENNKVIATRLRDLLISAAGAVRSEKLDLAALVSVEAADAVLKMAFREDPNGDPRLVSAAKLLVRSYLEQLFATEPEN